MLREIVNVVGIAAFAEAALLLFVIAFVALCFRTHRMSKAAADALAAMAIHDGVEPSSPTRNCNQANRMSEYLADHHRETGRE